MTAVAQTPCKILKLSQAAFLDLLQQIPEVPLNILKCLAERVYDKCIMLLHFIT